MKKSGKRITILGFAVLAVVAAVIAGIRYLPLNRIFKVGSTSEKEFVSNPQLQALAPDVIFFDFEVDPNTGNKNGLYQGISHSGQFSAKAFGKNSYSISVNRNAQEIGYDNLREVSMSAWVYIFPTEKEIQGSYVFSVNNDLGVNVCWKSVPVTGEMPPREKWFKISGRFDLSDISWKPDYKIQIYFWNNSSPDILVDDFYIVFGGPKERRGDSALVDMTKGQPFVPRFNHAPFPFIFLEKQDLKNGGTPFSVSPLTKIIAGRFTRNPDGCDDLLVINPDQNIEMYHFCQEMSRFVKIGLSLPSDLRSFFYGEELQKGSFTSQSGEQLIALIDGRIRTGIFDEVKGSCKNGDLNSAFHLLADNPNKGLTGNPIPPGSSLLAGDFDNDRFSEILITDNKGNGRLLEYDVNASIWKIAADISNPVAEWIDNDFTGKASAGQFMDHFSQDLILTAFTSKKNNQKGYSLRRFDAGTKQFIPLFPENQQYLGKIIGLDTLSPEDQFFAGHFDNSGSIRIFRYNRDWRYDLKEIGFNDTTFRILSNIDFKGYEKDHNPKYYGHLIFIPGHFSNDKVLSFLVIGRNYHQTLHGKENNVFENLPFLPDFTQIYRYPSSMK